MRMSLPDPDDDLFTMERRGDVVFIRPSDRLESFDFAASAEVAEVLLAPLRQVEMPMVVVDLSNVDFFGSSFLSLLLRCWKLVLVKGGQMVLVGVSSRARELLRITSLDIVWPIYENRAEALVALEAD